MSVMLTHGIQQAGLGFRAVRGSAGSGYRSAWSAFRASSRREALGFALPAAVRSSSLLPGREAVEPIVSWIGGPEGHGAESGAVCCRVTCRFERRRPARSLKEVASSLRAPSPRAQNPEPRTPNPNPNPNPPERPSPRVPSRSRVPSPELRTPERPALRASSGDAGVRQPRAAAPPIPPSSTD